jgi:two-component system invasion response regulator UvrY
VKILLVDDHVILREGVRRLLVDRIAGVEVGEASDEASALERFRDQRWDVVVLDLRLPGRGGVDVLRALRDIDARVPVLIMTMYDEEPYAVRAFRAGASGYLMKTSAPEELVVAVEKLAAGGKYVTPSLAEALAARAGTPAGTALELLSDRELEVLRRIGAGQTVKDIASDLSLSDKTVSTYRTRMLEKLGLRTTADLVRYAVDARLVE